MQAAGLLIENPLLDWGAAQPSLRRPTWTLFRFAFRAAQARRRHPRSWTMSGACSGTAGRWP